MLRLNLASALLSSLAAVPLAIPIRATSVVAASTTVLTNSAPGTVLAVPADFQTTLMRAGLDPKALAASGILANGVTPILQAAADQMNADRTALSTADAAFAAAQVQRDQLLRVIQSGLASQEDSTAYQAAQTALASATAQRQAALDATFAAATANISEAARLTLTAIRASRAQAWSRDFPTEFLVIARQELEWIALRDVLSNERTAARYPDLLSESAQASLAMWRADPAVSGAKSALDQNLAAVTDAWNTATGGQ